MSVSNKEIADCFRLAKERLNNENGFICHSLNAIVFGDQVVAACKAIVMEGLDSFYTLNDWLCAECPWIDVRERVSVDGKFCHLARLAWLDKLIEEYS